MVSEPRSYAAAAAVSTVVGVKQETLATTPIAQSPAAQSLFVQFISRVVPKSVPQRNSINRTLLLQFQAVEKINSTQSRNNKADARSPIRSASTTIPERNLFFEQTSVADPQRKAIRVCPSSISIALPQRKEGASSVPIARSPISAIFIDVPQWNQFRQRKYHPKDQEKSDLKKMEQSSDSATVASSARAKSKENEIEKKDVQMESSQFSCVESSSGVFESAIELKLSINSEFFDDYSSAYSELQSDVFRESSDLDFSNYSPSMWRLLLSELHVEHASAIEIPNGIGGNSSNVEAFANAMVRFRGGCRFENGRPNEGPMHIINSLENEIVYPKKYNLNPEVKTLLKRNVGVCSDDDAIISVVSEFRDLHIQSTETAHIHYDDDATMRFSMIIQSSRTSEGEGRRTTATSSRWGQSGGLPNARLKALVEYSKMALDCFSAVWLVVGNVWIFGGHSSSSEAPNMYRLCIVFLTFSCIGYAMPFIMYATICCCLPCIISILGFMLMVSLAEQNCRIGWFENNGCLRRSTILGGLNEKPG